MRSRLRFLAFVASTLALASAAALAQAPDAPKHTAAVAGVVTVDGKPAAGVPVWATDARRAHVTTETDAAGRYRFDALPEGVYVLGAFKAGYVTPEERAGAPFVGPAGMVVAVVDGEIPDSVDIALTRGGVVTGRVTDGRGRPLSGMSVVLTQPGGAAGAATVRLQMPTSLQTDDRGVYRAYGLPAGEYLVATSPTDEAAERFPQTYYTGAPASDAPKAVAVAAGAEVSAVDIVVATRAPDDRFAVRGRVVDADTGAPVAGVLVRLKRAAGAFDARSSLVDADERTDGDGAFRVGRVPRGAYVATARRPCGYAQCDYPAGSVDVDVDADVDGLTIRSARGATVEGQVDLEGVSDPAVAARLADLRVRVKTYDGDDEDVFRSMFDAGSPVGKDGAFRVLGIRPGRHEIDVDAPDGAPAFRVIRVEGGGGETPKAIEVAPDRDLSNLRVVVGIGTCSVRGRIRAVNGTLAPAQNLYLRVERVDGDDSDYIPADPDARHEFDVEGLLPGRYELTARADRGGTAKQTVTLDRAGASADVTLTIDLSAPDPEPEDDEEDDGEDDGEEEPR